MSSEAAAVSAASPLHPPLPQRSGERLQWSRLAGCGQALAIARAAVLGRQPMLVLTPEVQEAVRLSAELEFFLAGSGIPVLGFPDWETLPYDVFSPLPELVSERLRTLYRLPQIPDGVLVVPVATLLQRLPPRAYVDRHTLVLARGDRLDLASLRRQFERVGYQRVSQVLAHGEYAVRGALLDVFPMGSQEPYRIDLFDDEIDSLRTFDPDTQRSRTKVEAIQLLPAREFPQDEAAIAAFRQRYRASFAGDPQASWIYREVSAGNLPGGVEYYLPLFFEATETLFDYLPPKTLVVELEGIREAAAAFLASAAQRHEQRRHDRERPILPPSRLYLETEDLAARLKVFAGIRSQAAEVEKRPRGYARAFRFTTADLPALAIQARAADPAQALKKFLAVPGRRVLLVAESAGRREMLTEHLRGFGLVPQPASDWPAFVSDEASLALTVAPLEQGLFLEPENLALVTETQLYGERVRQDRRRKARLRDSEAVVRNLTELHPGAPVVHEAHGIGRYLGLQTLSVGGHEGEFLTLEYARGDKLYVPVASLHQVSRYTGASAEDAPLHRLGGEQWARIRRKAAQQAQDLAAELLDLHARRAAREGLACLAPAADYAAFAEAFAFEETPDQQRAIEAILADMASPHPMDRVVCGDVGFGKTEVAMRAAFVAITAGHQVAVVVPTTLLAQQHFENFSDRFADWPVRIESLSRFGTPREQKKVLDGLADGTLDLVVGTHKLLRKEIRFRRLGLIIIDEEHRFGVRHKEALKALRAEVDILTLTATPIPRTLNMALAGLRDLSVIATPPVERHPIKTFVTPWNDALVQEAVLRELKRGGQVYFLHNEVESIDQMAERLAALVPEARIEIAHGQLRERDLERVMRDFYHRRFHLLVCTTIIESGIDVPSANTILIHRADKLGLAQLHQLRGRVGRSHHRAYAYLITPPPKSLTPDARKRLEAIESLEELGAGFTLATHDLEIRGAGELLGREQSGQIHEVGFSLYRDLLERAVAALRDGRLPELDRPLEHGTEIDLGLPALLPSDYLPDVHARLVLYKRIASAAAMEELRELQVEVIDRFGRLPEGANTLFAVTAMKLRVQPHGIRRIEAGPTGGRVLFGDRPALDPARLVALVQSQPQVFQFAEGGAALRFFRHLEDPATRLSEVSGVLDQLLG